MMQPGSANGQGHITKSRNDMTLAELHEAYDALLLDKMQVADQKDKLFDEKVELKAQVKAFRGLADSQTELINAVHAIFDGSYRDTDAGQLSFLEGAYIRYVESLST